MGGERQQLVVRDDMWDGGACVAGWSRCLKDTYARLQLGSRGAALGLSVLYVTLGGSHSGVGDGLGGHEIRAWSEHRLHFSVMVYCCRRLNNFQCCGPIF